MVYFLSWIDLLKNLSLYISLDIFFFKVFIFLNSILYGLILELIGFLCIFIYLSNIDYRNNLNSLVLPFSRMQLLRTKLDYLLSVLCQFNVYCNLLIAHLYVININYKNRQFNFLLIIFYF